MRHWLQLATRNWSAKPFRSLAIVLAVALGAGTVVTVMSMYHSVEVAISEQVLDNWVGRSDITIESPKGHWGNVDASLEPEIAKLENVAQTTAKRQTPMRVRMPESAPLIMKDKYRGGEGFVEVDAVGIRPESEYAFRDHKGLEGRRIERGDRFAVVADSKLVRDLGLSIGDSLALEPYIGEQPVDCPIVGTFEAARVAMFQRPNLYMSLEGLNELRRSTMKVSAIDCIVRDDSAVALEKTADRIRALLRERGQGYEVTTATAKLNQLRQARSATHLLLLLFSSVALLTSFFIIVTTMSMGMVERIRLLGTVRCLGMTRLQMTGLVCAELIPLGIAGAVLGVPLGMALSAIGVDFVPYVNQVVPQVQHTASSMALGIVGGMITTLAACAVIIFQVARVSPLRATTPEATSGRMTGVIGAALVGVVLLLAHEWMIHHLKPVTWFNPAMVLVGMGSLYGGYVLVVPVVVMLLGASAVWAVAPMVGIRRKLGQDQVGRAPWRSAGVCWMLMVGLSLIVYFAIRGESIVHAWDFPSKMAGTFVWAREPVSTRLIHEVRKVPGVSQATPVNDVFCTIEPRYKSILNLFKTKSVFAGGETETFLSMAQLEFLEGNQADARKKLDRGGYILLPQEASHSFGYHLGDKVPITVGSTTAEFEVAGVVRSPAMDIAVSFFQADTYMMIAAAMSVLGTIDDLDRCFGIKTMSMFLMNIELPNVRPPAEFASDIPPDTDLRSVAGFMAAWFDKLPLEKERMTDLREPIQHWLDDATAPPPYGVMREIRRYQRSLHDVVSAAWEDSRPDWRWDAFREHLVLNNVRQIMNRPDAMSGSLRRLKEEIDRDIRIATAVVSAIPVISLIVASIGVANLMMVSVTTRSRQIAVLRAVGATKGHIVRLVLVEAMVLGVLGCGIGVLLGMHSAHSAHVLYLQLFGFKVPWVVPWPRIVAGIVLTWAVCVLAGIGPALRASRNNIMDAMQVT